LAQQGCAAYPPLKKANEADEYSNESREPSQIHPLLIDLAAE
jgi:hypothetical protein